MNWCKRCEDAETVAPMISSCDCADHVLCEDCLDAFANHAGADDGTYTLEQFLTERKKESVTP